MPAKVDTCQPEQNNHSVQDIVRVRALRLFRYLGELVELRSKVVRDLASYESVFWLSEVPHEPECSTPAWDGSEDGNSENWLRVDKPEKPSVPKPPPECEAWHDPGTLVETAAEPRLREEITDPGWVPPGIGLEEESAAAQPPVLRLKENPEVAAAWANYLETEWRPWKSKYQRWERVQRTYRKLFAIYQEQQRRGEQYELVLGVGVLLWTSNSGHRVCRPIVTARITVHLEPDTGRLVVSPAGDGADFALEQDVLEVDERPPKDVQLQTEQKATELESPWDRPQIFPLLKSWVQALPSAADAVFMETLECPEHASRTSQMAFAPVLMLRKRGTHSMRTALKKIVGQIDQGKPLPRAIRELCGDTSNNAMHTTNGTSRPPDELPEEILFPLPTNQEQLQILRRLGGRSGVLVQGPPGTGKSHTIVNLVSHLLASGKRVLITSQTGRALKVLRDKFPEDVRPLTVSLLDENEGVTRDLEQSVQGILKKVDEVDLLQTQREIVQTAQTRASYLSELAKLRRRQCESREAEVTNHVVPGTLYRGTAQAIAQAVSGNCEHYSWLPDRIGESVEPPLSAQSLAELCSLWEQCGPDAPTILEYSVPLLEELVPADAFEAAVRSYQLVRAELKKHEDCLRQPSAQSLLALTTEQLQTLRETTRQFIQVRDRLAKQADSWIKKATHDIREGQGLPWTSLESLTTGTLASLQGSAENAENADATVPELPPGVLRKQLLADAIDLLQYLEGGGRLSFWGCRLVLVRRCRYLWRQYRFAGRVCDNPATLQGLVRHLTRWETLERAWQEWAIYVKPPGGTFRHCLTCLEQHRDTLRTALQLGSLATSVRQLLGTDSGASDRFARPTWTDELLADVNATLAAHCEREAKAALVEVIRKIRHHRYLPKLHPVLSSLVAAAEKADAASYRKHLRDLAQVHHARDLATKCLALDGRLRSAAPALADALRSLDTRATLLPKLSSFWEAWAWRRAAAWLDRFEVEHAADRVAQSIADAERRFAQTTAELVGLKAWKSCVEQLDRNQTLQGSLKAWQHEVQKIGKGTGKHAETHRRNARTYMQQCRPAIPAWIMPLYRVAEQIEVEPEVFDVVIVDEASQTGPEGLILQYLAKQCIIVGDDKQISPEPVGIDLGQVQMLMRQYLGDIPFSATLGLQTSLFNQASIRYGTRITLREHFRCMPEIIRFSNDLCYQDTPLIPLRQYPPSRLTPILVRDVVDGYREGSREKVINRPEAAAVVKTVMDCLADPRYAGKSFGVICLQGQAQGKLIESMLLERVGPQPFRDENRRLLCGDPYSFQGDERDIIFISMVAAAEGECRSAPLTREMYRQRFNVAASRARDQMWVFHSIRESDLHPNCMRRKLLHFCYNPVVDIADADLSRCESQFERDVATELIRRGYRVVPQYPVAGKRIDLVVDGAEGRLAIECDGDAWHGPARYEEDMARQRMLERCGWQFVRVRGSIFYANPNKAVQEILEAIKAHGILPNSGFRSDADNRSWIEEISGNQSLEALETYTIDVASEDMPETGDRMAIDAEDEASSDDCVQDTDLLSVSGPGPAIGVSTPNGNPKLAPDGKPFSYEEGGYWWNWFEGNGRRNRGMKVQRSGSR